MIQTLRQSVRRLLRSPVATLAALASLALGIGANTTVFSLIDAVILRPLPVWRSEQLVAVSDAHQFTVSSPGYRDLAAGTRVLSGLAAFAPRTASLNLGEISSIGDVQVVSGNYFNVLGVGASRGRVLQASDDRPGRDPVVVLSSAFWNQSLGADPSAIGRRVAINGSRFTVVGVAQAGFRGVTIGANPAGWIALSSWPQIATGPYLRLDLNSRGWGWLRMVGRLRDGAQPAQARDELNALAISALRDSGPGRPELTVVPLRTAATGLRDRADLARFIALLMSVVLAVLGIACANVSGLLLARGVSRRRELAIRLALGASRARVARGLLADGLLLGALGTVFGVLIAMWTLDLLQRIQLPGGIDMSHVDVHIGLRTLAATTGLALIASLISALAPAFHGTRANIVGGLKDQPVGGAGSRQLLRGGLVAAQVTLSLVLLVGTALFARSLQTTLARDLGFDPRHVAYATTNVSLQRFSEGRAASFYQDALSRIRSTEGVSAAGWTRLIPGSGRDEETADVPGYVAPAGRRPVVSVNLVSDGYFEAMGIPILRGRPFAESDGPSTAPVVVVSEAASKTFWNGDAVGRHLSINDTEVTVVGVARDVPEEPGARPGPFVYAHAWQQIGGAIGTLHLVVRAQREPAAIVPSITAAIHTAAPTVPVLEARTLEEQLLDVLGAQRSAAALLGLLSLVALVLSAGGIYVMVAFWVTQRTREFGVRMALGASAGSIRRLAFGHVATAVLAGLVMGVPLAWALGRAARRMLFQVSPADPLSFGAGILLLMGVALAASLIPAQRAAHTDPLKALRADSE